MAKPYLPVSLVLGALLCAPAPAGAEPMDCSEDTLRMALGGQGTMPRELVRECLRIPSDDPEYGFTQYMISVHFRRRRDFKRAALFLDRAARTLPFATHPRVLYLLSQYLIAAGRVEEGLVAKDRFLSHSGELSSTERMRRTRTLYSLLHDVYEIRALEASEPEDFERFILASRFYHQAGAFLEQELQRQAGAVAAYAE